MVNREKFLLQSHLIYTLSKSTVALHELRPEYLVYWNRPEYAPEYQILLSFLYRMPGLHSSRGSMRRDESEKGTLISSHTLSTCSCLVALKNMLVNHTASKETNVSHRYWSYIMRSLHNHWDEMRTRVRRLHSSLLAHSRSALVSSHSSKKHVNKSWAAHYLKILVNLILSIYYRYLIQGTSAWSRYMLNFVFSKKLATGK